MNSVRFPGKVLADLGGQTVLEHVIRRCWEIRLKQERNGGAYHRTYIAVPNDSPEITDIANALKVRVYYGPENDVLERYMGAALEFKADPIIRITADCPMLDPRLCEETIKLFEDGGCSYAAIGWPMTFPKGYGCEVFSQFTLQLANELATDQHDREHVTPWMERNVRCKYLTQDKDESHLNYSVDTPEDLHRLREMLDKTGKVG